MATNYNPSVITNNLLLQLDVGNLRSYPGSGTTWTDISGNNYSGTLTNGPAYNSSNGGSLLFDGVDDYVNFGDVLDMGTSNITLSAWVRPTSTPGSDRTIISKAKAAVQNYRYSLGINTSLKVVGFVQGNSGTGTDIYPATTNALAVNTWAMVTMVLNRASVLELYINDIKETLIGSATISQWNNLDFQSDNPYRVGAYTTSDNVTPTAVFPGNIAFVQHYNIALTAAQILQNFNALRGRFGL